MSILAKTRVRRDGLPENSLCQVVAIRNLHDERFDREGLIVTVIPLNKRVRDVIGHSHDFDVSENMENYYSCVENLYDDFYYIDYPYLKLLEAKYRYGEYCCLFYNVGISDLVFNLCDLNCIKDDVLSTFRSKILYTGDIHVSDYSNVNFPIDSITDASIAFKIDNKYGHLSPNKTSISKRKCSCCNKESADLNEFSIVDGKELCKDCVNDLFKNKKIFYCRYCCSYHSVHKKYKHSMCRKGYNNIYTKCSICGKEILKIDKRQSPTGNTLCRSCAMHFNEKYYIRRYHNAPRLNYYKDDGKILIEPIDFSGFGVELEIDEGLKNSEKISKKIIQTMNEEVFCMRDGSVPKGIEIISMPHEEQSLYSMNWKKLFYMLKRNKYDSERLGKCGLHVHISKTIFKNKSAIKNMIYFYEKFKEDIILFSRRSRRSINRWSSFYVKNNAKLRYKDIEDVFNLYTTNLVGHSHRYKCVNLQNANTIEIRIMRGTINYKDFISALNFIIEIAKKSNTISADKIDDYCEWLKGVNKDTIEYMKKRNCFKKMYERS